MVGLYKDPHGKKIEMTSSMGAYTDDYQSSGEVAVEELRREVSQLKICLRKYEVREYPYKLNGIV